MSSAAPAKDADLVVFRLEGQRYAVELDRVERVVRMVALSPFPKAPPIVSGVFDLHGRIVPVANIRRRFGLRERPPRPADQLLIVRTAFRSIALAVDGVEGVLQVSPASVTNAEALVPGLDHVRGIVRLPDGLVFVHDIEAFLTVEEDTQLAAALSANPA